MSLPFLTGRTLNLNESKMELILNPNQMTPEKMAAWGRQFPKGASAGLNRTATQARTRSSQLVREGYNIKKSDLDKNIGIRRATEKKLEAALKVSGRRPKLMQFGAKGSIPSKPGTTGVSVEVTKGRRLIVAASFLAVMPSGHKGVFIRKTTKRLPIQELTGPSVPQMFFGRKVYRKLIDYVHEIMPKNLTDAINYWMR